MFSGAETILLHIFCLSVSKFLSGILSRSFYGPKPEYYKLLPMLCTNESNDFEPNLARDCAVTLAYFAQVIVPLSVIPSCLDTVKQIVETSPSWKAKAAVLELLQVKWNQYWDGLRPNEFSLHYLGNYPFFFSLRRWCFRTCQAFSRNQIGLIWLSR